MHLRSKVADNMAETIKKGGAKPKATLSKSDKESLMRLQKTTTRRLQQDEDDDADDDVGDDVGGKRKRTYNKGPKLGQFTSPSDIGSVVENKDAIKITIHVGTLNFVDETKPVLEQTTYQLYDESKSGYTCHLYAEGSRLMEWTLNNVSTGSTGDEIVEAIKICISETAIRQNIEYSPETHSLLMPTPNRMTVKGKHYSKCIPITAANAPNAASLASIDPLRVVIAEVNNQSVQAKNRAGSAFNSNQIVATVMKTYIDLISVSIATGTFNKHTEFSQYKIVGDNRTRIARVTSIVQGLKTILEDITLDQANLRDSKGLASYINRKQCRTL